jgi:hypothetical protein
VTVLAYYSLVVNIIGRSSQLYSSCVNMVVSIRAKRSSADSTLTAS